MALMQMWHVETWMFRQACPENGEVHIMLQFDPLFALENRLPRANGPRAHCVWLHWIRRLSRRIALLIPGIYYRQHQFYRRRGVVG